MLLCGNGTACRFTLIELLAVITIILLLAGLILGIAGNAQTKAAMSRAQGEIQALSTAAGNYQVDNGSYPRRSFATDGTNNTDKLFTAGSSPNLDPAGSSTPSYATTSLILYQLLCGSYYIDPTSSTITRYGSQAAQNGIAKPTIYFTFKDNQLYYKNNTPDENPDDVTYIQDPWGFSYGYSTAYQYDMDQINGGSTAYPNGPTDGYNPTFDLWSTAGYSQTLGKQTPANTSPASVPNLWVKNW